MLNAKRLRLNANTPHFSSSKEMAGFKEMLNANTPHFSGLKRNGRLQKNAERKYKAER